jgi:seryl-tRNA synthetase
MRELGGGSKEQEAELATVEEARNELAATHPQLPRPDAPEGEPDKDAVTLREVGERREFDFAIRDHLGIGVANGWIEMEKAAEASGSRFAYLMGDLVMVERGSRPPRLELLQEEGFKPVVPAVLVREGPLYGTGFFPGEREMIYEVPRDELFPGRHLGGLARGAPRRRHPRRGELPIRYAGISTCFRREAGAAGPGHARDLPGPPVRQGRDVLVREPSASGTEHERLLAIRGAASSSARAPLPRRRHPDRRPGAPGARKFDCEAWIPERGCANREVTSCFQHHRTTRRAAWTCRYTAPAPEAQPPPGATPSHGTAALAVGRNSDRGERERAAGRDGSVVPPPAALVDAAAYRRRIGGR